MNTTHSFWEIARWMWRATAGNRLQAVINTALGMVSVVISLSSVWAVKNAIDVAMHQVKGNVIVAVCIMASLMLASFACSMGMVWTRNILGIKAQNRMQQKMLDRILRQQWQGRGAMHSGDILNRLVGDTGSVVSFVAEVLPSTLSTFTLFVCAFSYMLVIDHVLALTIVGTFPIFMFISKFYMKRMHSLTLSIRESDSIVQSLLQDSVQNSTLIKTLQSEDRVMERLAEQHSELRAKVVKRTKVAQLSSACLNAGFASTYLLTFGWSALRLSANSITVGGMTAFLQLVNRVQGPARQLGKLAPMTIAAMTAAERLMMLEDVPEEEQGEEHRLSGACGVRLDNIDYAYADAPENKIIQGMSFNFRPGTCTAIIGETGAGKTTLLRMLLALISPTSGKITIYNDKEEVVVSPDTRCNFTYVPQGNTMISGTLRENLQLGSGQEAADEDINEALKTACADFVLQQPKGVDTVIMENGNGLSEGQAQRISIARALLRKAPIMILDEATSALDPETEKTLLRNLLADNHRTVIVITHRPAVLDYCDASLKVVREQK